MPTNTPITAKPTREPNREPTREPNLPSGGARAALRRSAAAQPVDASVRAVGCTCFHVRRLARRVTQFYDRALAPCGLRVTQFSLLTCLLRRPRAMQELADALDMDRTTLTRNLKPLLAARLVALEAGEDDARLRVVQLTAAGRARHGEASSLWQRAQADIDASWGRAQVASLHRLCAELTATFHPDRDGGSTDSARGMDARPRRVRRPSKRRSATASHGDAA